MSNTLTEGPFYEVSRESLEEYVLENDLALLNDGMHIEWVNSQGVVMARMMHGFSTETWEIRDEPNEQTLKVLTNKLNKVP